MILNIVRRYRAAALTASTRGLRRFRRATCRRLSGYDVAVAKVTLHWHARFTGRAVEVWRTHELDEDFQITDVWVRCEGRWQVVSRTSIPILKPS
jgi:hypothetical protein